MVRPSIPPRLVINLTKLVVLSVKDYFFDEDSLSIVATLQLSKPPRKPDFQKLITRVIHPQQPQ